MSKWPSAIAKFLKKKGEPITKTNSGKFSGLNPNTFRNTATNRTSVTIQAAIAIA